MGNASVTLRFVSNAEWPELAGRFQDFSFEQSLSYSAAAAAQIGGKVRFVLLEQDGTVVAAASVRIKTVPGFRRGIAWIASGPLMLLSGGALPDDDLQLEILNALHRQFVKKEGHILRLRFPALAFHAPDHMAQIAAKAGFMPTSRASAYRSIAIDLGPDEDALMKQLNGKWRTDLRYAFKSGITLEKGNNPDLIARFMVLFEEIQSAKNFRPDITPEFHFALSGPDFKHDILIATKDGQDLGGIVIGTCGKTAVYLFGATSDAGRRLRAGYFLTWSGISISRERGLDWYDLGGVDADANPSVARFKQRMNATSIEAAGPFEARPGGVFPKLVSGLETLRARLKAKG